MLKRWRDRVMPEHGTSHRRFNEEFLTCKLFLFERVSRTTFGMKDYNVNRSDWSFSSGTTYKYFYNWTILPVHQNIRGPDRGLSWIPRVGFLDFQGTKVSSV
uniref:Uncharacterized protein n=1 Tax=Grammatophora oceanica TaxID=210454 RepID=A0A7S1V3I0_9STRA